MSRALQVKRQRAAIDRVRAATAANTPPRPADVVTVLRLLDDALMELGLRIAIEHVAIAEEQRHG